MAFRLALGEICQVLSSYATWLKQQHCLCLEILCFIRKSNSVSPPMAGALIRGFVSQFHLSLKMEYVCSDEGFYPKIV